MVPASEPLPLLVGAGVGVASSDPPPMEPMDVEPDDELWQNDPAPAGVAERYTRTAQTRLSHKDIGVRLPFPARVQGLSTESRAPSRMRRFA